MPIVYCDQKLWRVVREWSIPFEGTARTSGSPLGDWCATLTKNREQRLVVLVSIHTCLTIVFPLCQASDLLLTLKSALRASLEDLNVAPSAIVLETERLDALELKRMSRSGFGSNLRYVEYFCRIELIYHTDLRRVQRNLNDLPHASGVPASAVSTLFARGQSIPSH